MIIHKVGETAGRIWHMLDEEGQQRLTALKKQVKVPDAILYMALGWLAREDKVEIEPEGRSFRVRLR